MSEMASLRRKIFAVIDVVLRVPPVFLVDTLIRNSSFDSFSSDSIDKTNNVDIYSNGTVFKNGVFDDNDEFNLKILSKYLLTAVGIVTAVIVFFLKRSKLIAFYSWLISVLCMLISYAINEKYIEYVLTTNDGIFKNLTAFIYTLTGQLFIISMFVISNSPIKVIKRAKSVGISFILPSLLSSLPLMPLSALKILPLLSATYAIVLMLMGLVLSGKSIVMFIYVNILKVMHMYRFHGLHFLIEQQWYRVNLPQVLRVFWLTRITEQAVFLIVEYSDSFDGLFKISMDNLMEIFKTLMTRGCDTYITVAGMTSVLSSICQGFGHAFQLFLMTEDQDEERNMGTVSAILFMILSLQTGLTSLSPEKRFARLYRNLCLLSTAVLHFIHSMVNPLLMSMSASHNINLNRHIRALSVCAFLVIFPYYALTYLWEKHSLSTWLLAITAFSIEVIIKVLTSLIIYTLFMIDARRETFWEKLDDYVYYIRSVSNTIEFLFGIFLFFNGAWILIFESGSTIRALMMVIHAYCNIWLQAKSGWQTFMKRRTAVYKISSLPEASPDKLRELDDLCSICYQELVSGARITVCNHIFHGVCLRKWLYVRDNCPLCHQMIYANNSDVSTNHNQEVSVQNENNHLD